MKPVLRFEHVSKQFILKRLKSRSFQDLLISTVRRDDTGRKEEFWALRDATFEVYPGEIVALVGHNGAGKSTALKIVSRIIDPTSGRIEIDGRVGALLELGTGFHPDLTGRENVYLNGAILGLDREQIRHNLDDIIEFAEIDRFVDVAVKNYSSGMFVRLGFSVAVHTNPDILLVDEVLAVGDVSFQAKCLKRIDELRKSGTTILLVSHDLNAVSDLCDRVVWLEEGKVVGDGDADIMIRDYMSRTYQENLAARLKSDARARGSGLVRIERIELLDRQEERQVYFTTGQPFAIEMHYQAGQRVEWPSFSLSIHRSDGTRVAEHNTHLSGFQIPYVEGSGTIRYTARSLPLLEGDYSISVTACDREGREIYDHHDRMYPFRVHNPEGGREGVITLLGQWSWSGEQAVQ